ncbi:MAG: sigma-54-dependent Fis family transcriptional regulator [Planctomycetes bacterium]|nr:sigma-54-dependent Fis family transcriptional regulator [Planctomycetota bacterium]
MREQGKGNILVVDDSQSQRDFVSRDLIAAGYVVKQAESGEKALELLKTDCFDIVLLDIVMPGIGGIETLKRIKQKGFDVEIVIVSAQDIVEDAVSCIKLGAFNYVSKPVKKEELLAVLAQAQKAVQLKRENYSFRYASNIAEKSFRFIAQSKAMAPVMEIMTMAAPTDSSIIIEGESGTGKELVARTIHQNSARSRQIFLAVNCGGLAENLLESELFGYEKGAFTGAAEDHPGLLEVADKGTLFLDEITEMSPKLQTNLLRVLETGEFRRVGSTRNFYANVRIIAATNKKLQQEVSSNRFREDLYYRLNVVSIKMPPLRERPEDFKPLVDYFLQQFKLPGKNPKTIADESLFLLQQHNWPGNIRELRNAIERLNILTQNERISMEDVVKCLGTSIQPGKTRTDNAGPLAANANGYSGSLADIEKKHILMMLEMHKGNKIRTAKALKVSVQTLYNKLKTYGIQ